MRNSHNIAYTLRNHMLHGVRARLSLFQPHSENAAQVTNANVHSEARGAAPQLPRLTGVRNVNLPLQTSFTPIVSGEMLNRSSFVASRLFPYWPRSEINSSSEQRSVPTRPLSPARPLSIGEAAIMRLRAQQMALLTPAQIAARGNREQNVNHGVVKEALVGATEKSALITPPLVAPKSEKVLRFMQDLKAKQAEIPQAEPEMQPDLAAIQAVETFLDTVLEEIEDDMEPEEAPAIDTKAIASGGSS